MRRRMCVFWPFALIQESHRSGCRPCRLTSSQGSTSTATVMMGRSDSPRSTSGNGVKGQHNNSSNSSSNNISTGQGASASSSSSSSSSSRLESGAPSRITKMSGWQAPSHIGAVPDDWPMYSAQASDYVLGPPIGFGASSVVYQASFSPLNGRACAVKVIDLEAFGRDLAELRRETQLMSLSKHPNVLRVRGCWVEGSKLHIATRLMSSGSILDIMRFSFPEGFEEVVIATILKQALEGLKYLHVNNWLHRDLKAANMLVDDDGTVLLGDFGVGVFLGEASKPIGIKTENGSGGNGPDEKKYDSISEGPRKSFVGTPCWMAPEVVERKGYGVKADIWSFGITALELTSGRAPHSRLPPVKILMKTLKDEPPQLDRTGNAHKYSKQFDDFIKQCLQKDPVKRPTAEKLLQHGFLKQAKAKKHLVPAILAGLPPLAERQERRRAMSIASLQNVASWDFSTSISSKLNTPASERFDPFHNFSGSFVNPASPNGSVRSSRIISIDGQHAFTQVGGGDSEGNFKSTVEAWRTPARGSMRKSRPNSTDFASGGMVVSTNDSWGRKARHRAGSVSFDLGQTEEQVIGEETEAEAAGDIPTDQSLPVIRETKAEGVLSSEGPKGPEATGIADGEGLTDSPSATTESVDSASQSNTTGGVKPSKPTKPAKELGGALSNLFKRL